MTGRDVVVATGLTPAQVELVQANTGLIGFTLGRNPQFVTRLYTKDDAWQDGYLGLCRAVQTFDPTRARLSTFAVPVIRMYIDRGRGAFEGKSYRKAWKDGVADGLGWPVSLDDEAVGPLAGTDDTERSALAASELAEVLKLGDRVCRDDLDRSSLAALLCGATPADVARIHGVARWTAVQRRRALVGRLQHLRGAA